MKDNHGLKVLLWTLAVFFSLFLIAGLIQNRLTKTKPQVIAPYPW